MWGHGLDQAGSGQGQVGGGVLVNAVMNLWSP